MLLEEDEISAMGENRELQWYGKERRHPGIGV
jgi:hypothetical protein